jgi:pyruvate,water dikinase
VRSEDEFDRVRPGDVLVCRMTAPSWNVLFGSIGALVTDEGGILSHPAIIAREFGIPAVVGTRRATTTIADGAIVEVDGAAGLVYLSA